jgi:hypothetical protein
MPSPISSAAPAEPSPGNWPSSGASSMRTRPDSYLVTVSVGMDISLKQRSVAGGQWRVKTRPL